jgi:threonine dehydratase
MKKYIATHNLAGSGKRLVGIVSGANLNFDRLRFVADRADVGERREAVISVLIPEEPGAWVAIPLIPFFPLSLCLLVLRFPEPMF